MGYDIIAAKTVFALIFALILVWVVRPAIAFIGTATCPNCDILVASFIFTFIPISIAFIGIYNIIGIFQREPNKRGY